MSDSLIIIPTYNELGNIEKMIRKVFSLPKQYHLLIIDDGSPDGTADRVKWLQKEYADKLFLIERSGKQGLGTAYITGFKYALEKTYQYIFEMDCDFSHNPDDLTRLYDACASGHESFYRLRYVQGGGFVNWPKDRNQVVAKMRQLHVILVLLA
ncbi:MAG: glycosyltransferase [Chitinophagales bacterium]